MPVMPAHALTTETLARSLARSLACLFGAWFVLVGKHATTINMETHVGMWYRDLPHRACGVGVIIKFSSYSPCITTRSRDMVFFR